MNSRPSPKTLNEEMRKEEMRKLNSVTHLLFPFIFHKKAIECWWFQKK